MRRPAVTACPATLRSAVGATGFWTLAPRCVHAPACPDALARSASRGSHARARYFILAVCMGGVGGEPEADAWMNSSRVRAGPRTWRSSSTTRLLANSYPRPLYYYSNPH